MIGNHDDNLPAGVTPDHPQFDTEKMYCEHCKKKQYIEWTFFNPDEDTEPTLAVCSKCKEAITLE